MKLSKLLPDCGASGDSGGSAGQGKQSQSKGGILAKACEFLADMRNINQRLADSLKRTEEANQENERLSSQIEQLQVIRWIVINMNKYLNDHFNFQQENAVLKQQLQNHGIVPPTSDIKFQI